MNVIAKLKNLDPVNKAYIEKYIRHLKLKQLKQKTIDTKVWRVYTFLTWSKFSDAQEVSPEWLEDYFIERRVTVSPFTLQGDILELKLFFRWLVPDREKELFCNIRMRRPRKHLPVDQLITREDIVRLVDVCDKPRDRALIMLMWDSGARIGELLSLNIGHVQFDRYGAVVIVNGKTGMRRLRLISSVPDLQTWVNTHPLRADANMPLFVTSRRYRHEPRRMSIRTVENKLKYVARKLGMTKPIYPHAIRHARLTDLTRSNGKKQGLSEMELRLVAGWEKNSAMPEVYIHLSGADVERKFLENAGFIDDAPDPADAVLEPRQCPRCKNLNAREAGPQARYEIRKEVVAEAVVHRDYTSTGSVQVMLFADRLEVWNPGRLPANSGSSSRRVGSNEWGPEKAAAGRLSEMGMNSVGGVRCRTGR